MADVKPIGRVAPGQSMASSTLTLADCRLTPDALEGKVLAFAPYLHADGGPAWLRTAEYPGCFVRAACDGGDGLVHVLLAGPLQVAVPASVAGDLVYLQDDLDAVVARREREEVEAWKASWGPKP